MEEIKKVIVADELLMQENRNLQIVQHALEGALKQVFGEGVTSDRFLDKARIPLICKNVEGLHQNYKDMKDSNEKSFEDIRKTTENNFEEIKKIMGKDGDDKEQRIRDLEAFKNNIMGKMAMVGVLTGIASSVVVGLLFIVIQHFLK